MSLSNTKVLERYRKPPNRLKMRIRSVLNFIGATGMTLATGGYARWVAPYQVEYTERELPLEGLPASFENFRIVQVTDLHTGLGTPLAYLRRVIRHVNRTPYDLAVITGDLVTHNMEWVEAACQLVGELRGPVIVTFGNHDYSRTPDPWTSCEVADALQAGLEARSITVLRNQAMPIEHADGRLWLVGLEDLWSGRFAPDVAFAAVRPGEPVIALSHNPDTIFELEPYGPQWILAGHTHGGQIRIPVAGSIILPVKHKEFDLGAFCVGRTRMYISRGVGFRLPVRFRCQPEVTTFVLKRAASA